ncbi:MAG: NAD(P)H-dependent oxidoreductase subunit E [Lentisphaeria bacterium]|nr:NAD(P)H-dependent oxidoreductase subunit E [Lentisphaeria bacterium]
MPIKDLSLIDHHIFMCKGGSCKKLQSQETIEVLRQEIENAGLKPHVHTTCTLCNGRCEDGPVLIVMPEGIWYKDVTPEVAKRIVKEHLIENNPIKENMLYAYGDQSVCSQSISVV